jgi:MoxR-like ATPase
MANPFETRALPAYRGTPDYIASESLCQIVNVAISLRRPLLVRGEPGTGKTILARSIAEGLGLPLIPWHVKSTTKAKDGLYVYDTVQRLHDSRFGDRDVGDIRQYIRLGPLGEALSSPHQVVLLIDEVDKADIEFPNDLLHELDRMAFIIPETGDTVSASVRPIVVITSNNEKELPDAFLRRCVFHFIEFPNRELLADIARVHFPGLEDALLSQALTAFLALRDIPELRKKPSTSELLDWVGALIAGGLDPARLAAELPFLGVLLKREEDLAAVKAQAPRRRW